MALAPLATVADLPDQWQAHAKADRALTVASSAIREAAGAAISEVVGTVTVPAPAGKVLTLPGSVRNVTAVSIDGTTVSDFYEVGNGLWRAQGWGYQPVPVTVSATFGAAEVPDDIVDMTCQLAVSWLRHDDEGGGSTAGLTGAGIDDANERYSEEAAGQVSPVFIPEVTRAWLRSRFSTNVVVVESA